MAEWSGFFDAHKVGDYWDRTYLAEDFAKFFAPLIGNGIFAGKSNELQVFQDVPASMSVVLSSGQSWIEGYGYVNDSDLKIPIDPADGVLGRIDRIVNQWSSVDRRIRTVWKKGTPAVNPVAPPLQWDADYKELNICILDVSAGLSSITQDKIRDTRADSSVCGWVTGLIDQVDTSTLFAQWESAYEKEFTEQKRAWEEFFKDIQVDLGIPVPSPDKANHVLAVDSNGGYTLSNEYASKEYADTRNPYNYAHNSDFTQFIAQAGIGEKHCKTAYYAGDRWILHSGTVTGEARADGHGYSNIRLNGTIVQIVENAPDVGTAAIEMVSGTADILYTDGVIVINSNGGVIKNVRLFKGAYTADNVPNYQPKGYGAELAECQRYFIRYSASEEVIFLICGVSSSRIYGTLHLPVNMRVGPSLTYHNVNVYPYTSGDSIAINGFTITGKTKENNAVYLRCTLASSPEKQIAAIRILNGGYIDLGADFPED